MPSEFSLQPYNLARPEKIIWAFPTVKTLEEALMAVKSKSLRSFLRKIDDELTKNNCYFEIQPINKEMYVRWLEHYEQTMREDGYEIIATEEWYDKKMTENKEVWSLSMYSNTELVGTNILTIKPGERLIGAFKTSKKNVSFSNMKNASLGSAQDFLVVRFAIENGIPAVSFGQSRNAFGVINSFGQLEYKLKLGLIPTLGETTHYTDSLPINDEGWVTAFCLENQHLGLYTFSPEGLKKHSDIEMYLPPEIKYSILSLH